MLATVELRQNFDFLTNVNSWYVVKNLIFLSPPFCFWIFFFISMKIRRQLLAKDTIYTKLALMPWIDDNLGLALSGLTQIGNMIEKIF